MNGDNPELEDQLLVAAGDAIGEDIRTPDPRARTESPTSPFTLERQPSIVLAESPEVEERETFGKRIEFLLTTVGYAVGVGNVWRFPYLCYQNGGGSFLIPYLFALVFLGSPAFLLELAIGQRFRRGTYHSFLEVDPRLRSIGLVAVYISSVVGIYYNVVIAWSVFYFFNCFQANLPWATDDSSQLVNAASDFWLRKATDQSTGFYDINRFNWPMVGCLVVSWLVIFICIRKGIKSSGKVVYVTATLPYILLVLLCVRGVTLEGSADGLRYYLTPDMSKLAEPQVWATAANQIFYSLGTGFGSLIAYGSYNPRDENVVQDAILVPAINAFTSLFAGIGIFAILGHLAHESGVEVSEVADGSTGLAFIAYPAGLSLLPAPQFFSMCFFAMLFCLGVDSEFATVEVLLTFIKDMKLSIDQPRLAAAICFSGFCCGLVFTTDAGLFWFEWLDHWCSTFSLMMVVLAECVAVGWLYGIDRFAEEFRQKCKRQIQKWWWICIKYVAPACFVILVIINFVSTIINGSSSSAPGGEPVSATALGWFLALMPAAVFIYCWFAPFSIPEHLQHSHGHVELANIDTQSSFT